MEEYDVVNVDFDVEELTDLDESADGHHNANKANRVKNTTDMQRKGI